MFYPVVFKRFFMRRLLFFFLLGIAVLPAGLAQSPAGYETYCNSRFGYCLAYPLVMTPQPESGNRDGRVFKEEKTGATLTVWGRYSTNPDEGGNYTLAQQYAADLKEMQAEPSRQVTYKKQDKDFFVISGYVAGRVFYQKTVLQEESFAYAVLEYPQAAKEKYDAVSKRIFKSFR